jgi:hypothetical protein
MMTQAILLLVLATTCSILSVDAFVGTSSFSQRTILTATKGLRDINNQDVVAVKEAITADLEILHQAAETKQADTDDVLAALQDLEQKMRQAAKEDPTVAADMLHQLTGDWRLVFTTGTKNTQDKYGRINYFPLKAIQSFNTVESPMTIENGIYIGDFCVILFQGSMEFDLIKRKLEFDFTTVTLLQFLDVQLKRGEAAELGAKTGLGSASNVANAAKKKAAFFNWISADDKIATARGGGGGLALWKRVQ